MILSNSAKFFLILSLFYSTSTSCRYWPGSGNSQPSKLVGTQRQPFPTKEPDTFRADVIITTGNEEEVVSIAKKGESRRYDFASGNGETMTVLQGDKSYLISSGKKIYAEVPASVSEIGYVPDDPLTSRLLHVNEFAEFESLGKENGLAKYQAKVGGRTGSTILIFVDEAIGMPVRQEFYTAGNEGPTLQYSVEMRNFTADVDAAVFELPEGFRKVSESEFAVQYRIKN